MSVDGVGGVCACNVYAPCLFGENRRVIAFIIEVCFTKFILEVFRGYSVKISQIEYPFAYVRNSWSFVLC